jgi:phosphoenolpyruvate carboxylase
MRINLFYLVYLLLVLYLNFERNKLIDMRDVSKQYHEVIKNIIKQANVESELKNLNETVDKQKNSYKQRIQCFCPNC